MAAILYKQLVGSLLYIVCMMHPDVSFTVVLLSHFMANPG
jgi:hypothetical protein